MILERGHFDSSKISKSFITESLGRSRRFSYKAAYELNNTVFLSHKHDDLKDLKGVMGKLKEMGVEIYIDSMDNSMPDQTSAETAKRIKKLIKDCDKFMLLATDKAIKSYWCNWELGVGDVYKYIKHIALIPMKEKDSYDFEYVGNEYLQLYPYVEYRDGTTQYSSGKRIPKGYYVRMPEDKQGKYNIVSLKRWLKR